MNYQIHIPKGPLAHYVKCIWALEKICSPVEEKILLPPTGCCEIIFDLTGCRGWISGQRSQARTLETSGFSSLISLMLRPATCFMILGMPASELTDLSLDIHNIWGTEVDLLTEKLCNTKNFNARVALIEEFLLQQVSGFQMDEESRVLNSVKILSENAGNCSIDFLARESGVSRRHMERLFRQIVGLSPKKFARVIRFQKCLDLLQHNNSLPLTELAYITGFSDQAHFNREFKNISSLSPAQYLRSCTPFSDYYSFR